MNWGKGLALALIAFAGMMAYFVITAARETEPLITEQYYEQELRFQQRIDAGSRALSLDEVVRMEASTEQVRITFPQAVKDRLVTGTLLLLRAEKEHDDHTVSITKTGGGLFEATVRLQPGRYIAQLDWRMDDLDYYSEDQLIVP